MLAVPNEDGSVEEEVEYPDYPMIARLYAEMVVSGEIPACRYVKQACQRYLDMLEEASKANAPFYFSDAWAVDFCDFFDKMARPAGGKKGDTLESQPWQIMGFCHIFGFRRNDPDYPNEIGARLTREVYWEVPRGSGKALALDTPIPTPSGWTTMGAIGVGDLVYSQDGSVTRVVNATDVMRGHECYQVTFSNGESVIADAEHLWMTEARIDQPGVRIGRRIRRWKGPSLAKRTIGKAQYWYARLGGKEQCLGRVGVDDAAVEARFQRDAEADLKANPIGVDTLKRVRTTKEIASSLTAGSSGEWNHSVEMPGPIWGQGDLPLDPYLFGAWLGDGDSDGARLTCSKEDKAHWLAWVSAAGFSATEGRDGNRIGITGHGGAFRRALRQLDVLGKKHIPAAYLRASRGDRLALLQGLMDTDGSCSADGHSQEFYSCNRRLAANVSELLATLGVRHSLTSKLAILNGKECGTVYTARFCVRREQLAAFRMGRKVSRMRGADAGKAWRNNTVQIVGCEPVDSVPVRCITVDHPSSMFLFGRTMLPTHNSPTAAVIGLYCWLNEDEVGSQIFIGAPKEEQARYVFDPMSVMVTETPELQSHYGIDVTKKLLRKLDDPAAKVRMISSIADREDGANPHVVIMEELHAQDESLFNVMDSSLGKRVNNLFISITTAGNRAQGVCWNTRKRLINVLAGIADEQSFFGVIYTLDDDEIKDKRIAHDPARWIKCNPMWGITLSPSSLMERLVKAKSQSESAVLEFERTRLNIWSNGAGGLISDENWAACERKGIDILDFRGKRAFIGGDLGSKSDLSSIGIIFEVGPKIVVFNEHFVPAKSKSFLHDEFGPLYTGWVRGGHLTMTNGGITDYGVIEARIRLWCQLFDVAYIGFDTYQSNQILASLFNDGLPAGQVAPGTKTVSDPTKDLLARIENGLLEHDGNPVTRWMAMNVVGHFDRRGNVLAQKDDEHSPYKIDGIAALINANVARMDAMLDVPKKWKSVYEMRGGLAGENDDGNPAST